MLNEITLASSLFQSPLVKHCPSVSPFSSKFLHAHKDYHQISHMSSSKYLQMFGVGAKTSKLGGSRSRGMCVMASLGGLLGVIFTGNDTGESTRQQYASVVQVVNGLEAEMSALSDSDLRDKTSMLKERAQQGSICSCQRGFKVGTRPSSFQYPTVRWRGSL